MAQHKARKTQPRYPQHGPRPLPLFLEMLRHETADAPDRLAAALAGLKAYQQAPRGGARRLAAIRHRQGRARLRLYRGGIGDGRPVIVIPSLINPPTICDLADDASLMRHLASRGHRALLLDWGHPAPADAAMDLTAHVERIILPLIRRMPEPPVLVGYCLGGTLALGAACAARVAGVALVAAPWRFSGFGDAARADMASLWQAARPSCSAMGVVPMEVLQSGFWRLDPARTIAKYEAFAAMDQTSDAARRFIALEDWANAGAPLPFAAGAQLFEQFVGADQSGSGGWRIKGVVTGPGAIDCPAIEFVSRHDRIVPAATAADLPDRHDLSAGHVGMMVGSKAQAQLWEPLADWIAALP